MRYGIFSDIHSNLEALEAVISAYRKENIDCYYCAGDIVGYGADPALCIRLVKQLSGIVVAGNHDRASVDLLALDYFNPYAQAAILWTKARLDDSQRHYLGSLELVYRDDFLTLVHGSLDSPEKFNYIQDSGIAEGTFSLLKTEICFLGHSHYAGVFVQGLDGRIRYSQEPGFSIARGEKYIVNVGSVGQPRDHNNKAAYCIYDTDKKAVQIKRVSYNIETARKKIIDSGLPRFLADRLLEAR